MRKNILSLSIATMIGGLGFAGAASAAVVNVAPVAAPTGNVNATLALPQATTMAVNPNGTGHILLVPYFTAQGDNVSLLNLVNTDTKNGKAVKLRYRGAANSDDLYDITILLSPGDVWTGSVLRDGTTGAARMVTTDNTCTRPAKADVNTTFATTRLGAGATTAETLEGYIEILNVADIPFNAANATATTASTLYAAIKHASTNIATCTETTLATLDAEIVGADQAALGTAMVNKGLAFPTGGLFANWTIVDWAKKGTYTGDAVALEARTAGGAKGTANYVLFPQKATPVLDQYASTTAVPAVATTIDGYTADPVLRGATPAVSPRNYDLPDLSTPYVSAVGLTSPAYTAAGVTTPISTANSLSSYLATTAVINEFITSPVSATNTIPFSTDWVFSMPSRRYAVAIAYGTTVGGNVATFNTALASNYFTATNSALNTAKTRVCVAPGPVTDEITFFNREENTSSIGAVVSPQVTTNVSFCGETSVLTFNDTNSLLGAKIATQQITTGVTGNMHYEGWASIPTRGLNGTAGLPILGSAFVKGVSATAGNLGGTWSHRSVNP